MNYLTLKIFVTCSLFGIALSKKLYTGDKVLRLVPSTVDQFQWIYQLFLNADRSEYDFWTEPAGVNRWIDVHVDKDIFDTFCKQLDELNLNYTVTIDDVQKLIDEVEADSTLHRQRRETRASIVGTFALYNDIVSYLNNLCTSYPALTNCGSVGTTSEGRDLRYIKIGSHSPNEKQIIFIECGAHSREWIGPATGIYIINRLVTTYATDPTAKRMLDRYDFFVIPSANPDGYEYSRADDRLWRKTRSRTSIQGCYGVDPNRNYDSFWGTSGSSDSPCSEVYQGPRPFSEPETLAIANFMKARKDKILAFFSIHSYAQMWLIPYGDRVNNYAPSFDEMLRVAQIGGKALMAVNDHQWMIGNTVDLMDPASGGIDDWAKLQGIKYTYTLELRPSGESEGEGFIVPESEIDPSGREVWAGLIAAIDAMQGENSGGEITSETTGTGSVAPIFFTNSNTHALADNDNIFTNEASNHPFTVGSLPTISPNQQPIIAGPHSIATKPTFSHLIGYFIISLSILLLYRA